MFNVTLLTYEDNKKYIDKQSETFTSFALPSNYSDSFDHRGPNMPKMVEHENRMVDILVKSKSNKYKDVLDSVKFDAGITSFIPSEKIIGNMFDIPLLSWFMRADPV